ncbi:hypothetical protein BDR26DRAFT_188992 [Obelidium mucronatum]|nr:hypothetical protein BDR26DRAFT_188992 [Obelidium mucronatum]
MPPYKFHLCGCLLHNHEYSVVEEFEALNIPRATELDSVEDANAIVVVMLDKNSCSKVDSSSPLFLQWKDLLSKEIGLLFVIDETQNQLNGMQPEVVSVWEQLKTKAMKVYLSYYVVPYEIGANYLNLSDACVRLANTFESYNRDDPKKQLHYMKKAADLGVAEAQLDVARTLAYEYQSKEDLLQALHYYKLAAEHNVIDAHAVLARWYATGNMAVEQDIQKALTCWGYDHRQPLQ